MRVPADWLNIPTARISCLCLRVVRKHFCIFGSGGSGASSGKWHRHTCIVRCYSGYRGRTGHPISLRVHGDDFTTV